MRRKVSLLNLFIASNIRAFGFIEIAVPIVVVVVVWDVVCVVSGKKRGK
jgi:hypothetical protein